MKSILLCSLLLSLSAYGMSDTGSKTAIQQNAVEDSGMRNLISLIEAFMAGKLQAKEVLTKKSLAYNDYRDSSQIYETSLEEAHNTLIRINSIARWMADGDEQMAVQIKLWGLSRFERLQYLRNNLSEIDKSQFQMLRLYDFLRPIRSQELSHIAQNRSALVQALKEGDVYRINLAHNNATDLGEFVALEQRIQQMAHAVENGREDEDSLLVPRSSCVIS